jgi:hypothetical protein
MVARCKQIGTPYLLGPYEAAIIDIASRHQFDSRNLPRSAHIDRTHPTGSDERNLNPVVGSYALLRARTHHGVGNRKPRRGGGC